MIIRHQHFHLAHHRHHHHLDHQFLFLTIEDLAIIVAFLAVT